MSISDALKNGLFIGGSKRLKGIANSLRWRSAYCNDDFYEMALNNGQRLHLSQIQNGEVTGLGTGANVWPAAVVLAKFLEKVRDSSNNPDLYQNLSCCELGAGTGLVGLTMSYLGCRHVTLTDQIQLLPLMNSNIDRFRHDFNLTDSFLSATVFDWSASAESQGIHHPFDLVVISECIVPKLFPIQPLVNAIQQTLAINGTALVAYEHRHFNEYDPRDMLSTLCQDVGLTLIEVSRRQMDEVHQASDIHLYQITWNSRCEDCGSGIVFVELNPVVSDLNVTLWNELIFTAQIRNRPIELCQVESGQALIGHKIWPSSIALSKYLLSHELDILNIVNTTTNSTCLELGSGVGLTSIVLSTFIPNLICTDKRNVIPLLRRNLDFNIQLKPDSNSVEVRELEWSNTTAAKAICSERSLSLVVGSDLVYDTSSIDLLINLCYLFPVTCKLLLANEIRSTFDIFLTDMTRIGYSVTELGIEEVNKNGHLIPVRLVMCEIKTS